VNLGHDLGRRIGAAIVAIAVALATVGCSGLPKAPITPPQASADEMDASAYIIGPTDSLSIFVWRQPELSTPVIVRPDGKISIPLIDDLQAAGKTPTELAKSVSEILSEYIQDPKVTVLVTGFVGPFDRQIRVVGEAAEPKIIPFRRNMTVLDVMIQVGGLTEFAAGNRAVIVRKDKDGKDKSYRVRLDDLLKDGNVKANAYVLPGDVLIIPQSWF
jgi:polysaccharide export outer membrane protein